MRSIREVGTNWIVFRREDLFRALPLVGRENSQGEHYLNDVFPILIEKGERVSVVRVDTGGAMGINSRADLARTTRIVRERINARHLANGVTLDDPETTYIDVDVRIGRDTVIHPMTFLSGETRIATGCEIGSSTRRWGRARSSSSRSCAPRGSALERRWAPTRTCVPGPGSVRTRSSGRSSRSRRPRSPRPRRCRT
jgi:NDP-sugar pyrophosphorylase family protein